MASFLDEARRLDALGFNIIPASKTAKKPILDWKEFQTRRTTDKLELWFRGGKQYNLCLITGAVSGAVVLDLDSIPAYQYWHERIGDELDRTVYCISPRVAADPSLRGLGHYYFSIGPDDDVRSRSRHSKPGAPDNMHWDLKAEGGIALLPPSADYTWIRSPWDVELEPMPRALRTPKAIGDVGDPRTVRSKLADLLQNPGEGGRNIWMTKVAGHYAKMHANMRDLYEVELEKCWDMIRALGGSDEYTRTEFEKTRESVWRAENAKDPAEREAGEHNGWLVSSGYETLVQCRVKKDDRTETRFDHWADFNLRALGVVEDQASNRTYDVEVYRRLKRDTRRALLPASVLADSRRLPGWLAELGVGIAQPENAWPKMAAPERLRRYLEAQEPPHFQVVDSLGWHDGGFVCHEGVITPTGLQDFEVHKPNPRLINWAPYRYGFGSEQELRDVLNEILTFHDETVASVFGSWAVACLLKPQIHEISSQFPFMALEAPSESGKTTGMFSMLLQLMGNTQGQIDPTRASLRDYVSAHQSGIVWIDDLSDTQHIMDLLRQATGEGSVSKKGEDRHTQEVVRLVAPIVISGEALQLQHQKALMDRAVMLTVPSPTKRMSLVHDGQRQWLDVIALRQRYPDLTRLAGTLVKLALEQVDVVRQIPDLTPPAGGRWGDKIAIVRMGARRLATLTGSEAHVDRVDRWAGIQHNLGSENSLTTKLVPAALAALNWPSAPHKAEGRWPATPAFVHDRRVWFRPEALADWWAEKQHGRVLVRTESAEALLQQAEALETCMRRRFNLDHDPKAKLRYYGLDGDLSRIVVERSRGEEDESSKSSKESPRGVHPGQRVLPWVANLPPELQD